MARANGVPGAVIESAQTNSPAFPFSLRCRHSISRMKFWYCRSVRRMHVGTPVLAIKPSRTENVSGAQLTLTQPLRSRPLNSGLNSCCCAESKPAVATNTKHNDRVMS
jgi:hypothetical protein